MPVLADLTIGGQPRKVVMVANRNGFFYVLDRESGKFLLGKPFTSAATNWAREIGADGRPVVLDNLGTPEKCIPDQRGGTNFMPPSFDPVRRLFFVTARETCTTWVSTKPANPTIALGAFAATGGPRRVEGGRDQFSALRAIDPATGEIEVGAPLPDLPVEHHARPVGRRHVDGVGAGVQRQQRGVPQRVRFGDRQAAVALSDGRADLGRSSRDLHARWPPVGRGPVRRYADRICIARRIAAEYGREGARVQASAPLGVLLAPSRSLAACRQAPSPRAGCRCRRRRHVQQGHRADPLQTLRLVPSSGSLLPRLTTPAAPNVVSSAARRSAWSITATWPSHARQIAHATSRRSMPPWPPEPGYGRFADERRLTDHEIETLRQWAAPAARSKAIASSKTDAAGVARRLAARRAGSRAEAAAALHACPPAGTDVFRNFVIPGSARRRPATCGPWSSARDNPRILHHASLGVDRTRAARNLDRADPEPGFAAMPDSEVQNVTAGRRARPRGGAGRTWRGRSTRAATWSLQLHLLPDASRRHRSRASGSSSATPRPGARRRLPSSSSRRRSTSAGTGRLRRRGQLCAAGRRGGADASIRTRTISRGASRRSPRCPTARRQWLIWIKGWDFRRQDEYRYAAPARVFRAARP